MKVLKFLILAICTFCADCYGLFDVLEAADVLKSNARSAFDSDQHFARKIESLHAMVADRTSKSRQKTHPFMVRISDDCDRDCYKRYVDQFTSRRITAITRKIFLVTASATEMETFAADNLDLVKYHFPMVPEMKIDASVAELARTKNCAISQFGVHSRHSDRHNTEPATKTFSTLSFNVLITPLEQKDMDEFLEFTYDSSKTNTKSPSFSYHYDKHQRPGEQQNLVVTLSDCAQAAEVLNMFARRREVMWIERNHPAFTHNRWAKGICDTADSTSKPLETNSEANFTGRGDIIGVIDTGIDMKNCYFRDPDVATPYVWADVATELTPNFNHRKVIQYYMHDAGSEGKTDTCDDYTGHGTHVAGIAAGRAVERYGDYKTYEGMNSEAKIAFFDIGDVNSSLKDGGSHSLILPSNLNTGLFSIMKKSGARVFTNSWGTSSNSYDAKAKQVDTFMWENKDCLVLFSAGNSGATGANSINSPGTCKNAATVGASLNDHDSWLGYEGDTDEAYGIEAVAGFSSIGPTKDNRLKPDILAPGFWTTSALGAFNSSEDFCQVIALRGTSMACPTAAGFALKIRRYFLDGFYPGGARNESAGFTPSGALLKGMLVHSGQKMTYRISAELATGDYTIIADISNTYPSNTQGYGRIQMNKVLHFAAATTEPLNLFVIGAATSADPHYREFTSSSLSPHTYTFLAGSTTTMRITLSYTDFPGNELSTESAGEALKNVLTVEVASETDPLSPVTPYQVGGTYASNLQVIDISVVAGVHYTVTVRCTFLLIGPQPYALIVTGDTTYLEDGPDDSVAYSIPSDNFTANGGALKYILALGFLAVFLMFLVYYIRKVSKKHTDMMLDPQDFEEDGDLFQDEGRDANMGGKKSVFAKIRSIRSNHRKAQQSRNQPNESEGYYE